MKNLKPIINFPGYFISPNGDVFSNKKDSRVKKDKKLIKLKTQLDRDGYRLITLRCDNPIITQKNRKYRTFKVSRLLAQTFLKDFTDNCVVMHLNNIRNDDRIENLRVGTTQDNVKQRDLDGRTHRGEKKNGKLIEEDVMKIKTLIKNNIINVEIAKMFNVSKTMIGNIKNNKNWSHIILQN